MGLLNIFHKKPAKEKKPDLAWKKKEAVKKRKAKEQARLEAEKKKKQFQAVPSGIPQAPQPKAAVKKEKGQEIKKKIVKEDTGDAYKILIKPLITEKLTNLAVHNQYGFVVSQKANKQLIGEAITKVYGVKPIKVHIINVRGKRVRSGRFSGQTKNWKKAIITLKAGDKIEIYETVKS